MLISHQLFRRFPFGAHIERLYVLFPVSMLSLARLDDSVGDFKINDLENYKESSFTFKFKLKYYFWQKHHYILFGMKTLRWILAKC